MNFFKLVFRDLANFIKGRKNIFMIVAAAFVFNMIGIAFFYGYFLNSYKQDVAADNKTLTYIFTTHGSLNKDKSAAFVDILTDEMSFPKITACFVSDTIPQEDTFMQETDREGTVNVIGKFSQNGEGVLSGRYFTAEEAAKGLKVAIPTLDSLCLQPAPLTNGDFMKIGDADYKLVGQIAIDLNAFNAVWIPLNTYIQQNFPLHYAHVEYEKVLSASECNALSARLKALCPDIQIKLPPAVDTGAVSWFFGYFSQILVLFVFALLNIFSLIYYWISTNTKKHGVFLLCGCPRSKLYGIVMAQILILALAATIIGLAVIGLVGPLLIPLDIFTALSVGDYLTLSALNLVISFLLGLFITRKAIKKTDVRQINLGGGNH